MRGGAKGALHPILLTCRRPFTSGNLPICIQNDAHVVAIVACMYLFLCGRALHQNIEPSIYVGFCMGKGRGAVELKFFWRLDSRQTSLS